MSGIDREWIDKLIYSHNIVTVISRYVPITRKGRNYWGRCPFHHEKTPSFSVDESRQFYHCYGCGESGDIIRFVQKIENIDFMEAIRRLASEAKIEIPTSQFDGQAKILKEKKEKILAINRQSAIFYHNQLLNDEGKIALDYLHKRGITDFAIKRFALGYSPDYNKLIHYLSEKGYLPEDMKLAGVADKKDDSYYDVFGARLIIPIINNFDEVIGFGGRSLEKNAFAKYRNTASTPVFDKSKTIFAINELKKAKQNAHIDYSILCEGYMDVIALQSAGFNTAVASMGTSLTREQAKLLLRFAPLVYICYDGDAAGQKATLRGLEILEAEGLEVKVVVMPQGLDPDDVVKSEGTEGFKKYLVNSLPLMTYKLNMIAKEFDMNTKEGKSKYAIKAVQEAAKQHDFVSIEAALKIIQSISGFTYESLRAQLNMSVEGIKPALIQEKKDNLQEKAIKYILWVIINNKDYAKKDLPIEKLPLNDFQKRILDYAISNKNIKSIFLDFDESEHKDLGEILNFGESLFSDEQMQREYYEGYLAQILSNIYENELQDLNEKYSNEKEKIIKDEIIIKIRELTEKINELKTKGVGIN